MKSLYAIKKFMGFSAESQDKDILFEDIEIDSRKCKANDVFLARCGSNHNGLDYIDDVIAKGVSLILIDPKANRKEAKKLLENKDVKYFFLTATRSIGRFASWFYGEPSTKLRLIGVTGTNGKSTVAYLVATMLNALNYKCAIFGTLGFGFPGELEQSSNTTLDVVYLNRYLDRYVQKGADHAVLEVSSIGVDQGRIDHLTFSVGAFTNLTRDHLDYHKTMEAYKEAKAAFLRRLNTQKIVINTDDPTGLEFASQKEGCTCYGIDSMTQVSALNGRRCISCEHLSFKDDCFNVSIKTSYGMLENQNVHLLGRFNVSNYLCAVGILQTLKITLKEIGQASAAIRPVTGRMECFSQKGKPRIIVDYAHTPDGVESALRAARNHCENGKIICVLGCGGDRDKGKRPMMAIKSSVFADRVIFTMDNPRSEDPKSIIDDMLRGVSLASNVSVVLDRKEAIAKAFALADENDCVLIAGKGHEDYQILKNKTIHFSDREQACALLGLSCD
ncbi:UDP-N-acetylmuramoyl-L-alanyl-D-glutamate--2,6-diaminopimelate ligase [Anaerobiospirillum thomasii]|uniref:UDP-N-acetylmuramoyl-L-alanyl-D-glutamate--2,6-diaminopimelate ligase n=1 Tax=Anaerobiospirillum thomasii TaxID=179995 RepID=A0A2X0VFS1_9GAMM|nr:UDP-N-acetylmuramoyl-L-alanyl-D-glutamate--2,6-diaminopimelate ligase [Anaerobiospirillum thomasii]SPT69351.1 UDP-N-acetylmuramoyl-L-alanyl-D-glutamate--2,6-diaminopimelate ligase [Anaerobiospirillum thomasii]SPT72076.1 UDP-N-acetylmuramoyl-L-alanyl-D-glutamate--2,6-diaminopimelate ligase [Anaerobiospirillum thomasii]